MTFSNDTSLSGSQRVLLLIFVGQIVLCSWLFLRNAVDLSDWFLMAFVWIGRNSYATSGFLDSPANGKLEWFLGPVSVGFVCSLALIIRFWGKQPGTTKTIPRHPTLGAYLGLTLGTWALSFLVSRLVS